MLQITHQPREFIDELTDCLIGTYYPESGDIDDLPHPVDSCYISSGYFSSVWAIPGEPFKVLKVSHREEDACRSYMEWAAAHPHPNAPKIYSIEHRDHLMFVVMDRYYPLTEPDDTPFEDSLCKRENVPGHKVLMGLKKPNHKLGHEQLCARIRREFVRSKFDLHQHNVMQDRYGNIIITDPVSFEVNTYGETIEDF